MWNIYLEPQRQLQWQQFFDVEDLFGTSAAITMAAIFGRGRFIWNLSSNCDGSNFWMWKIYLEPQQQLQWQQFLDVEDLFGPQQAYKLLL